MWPTWRIISNGFASKINWWTASVTVPHKRLPACKSLIPARTSHGKGRQTEFIVLGQLWWIDSPSMYWKNGEVRRFWRRKNALAENTLSSGQKWFLRWVFPHFGGYLGLYSVFRFGDRKCCFQNIAIRFYAGPKQSTSPTVLFVNLSSPSRTMWPTSGWDPFKAPQTNSCQGIVQGVFFNWYPP